MKYRYPLVAVIAAGALLATCNANKIDNQAANDLHESVAKTFVFDSSLEVPKSIFPYSHTGYADKQAAESNAVQVPYARPITIVPDIATAHSDDDGHGHMLHQFATPPSTQDIASLLNAAQQAQAAAQTQTPVKPAAPIATPSKANYLVLPGTQVEDFQKLAKAAGYNPGAADNIGGQKLLTVMQQDIPKMEKLAGTTNPDGQLSAKEISAATSNTTDKNTLARLAFYQTLNDTKNPNTGKSHMATFYTPAAQATPAATSAPIKKTTRADFADAKRVPTLKLPGTIALEFEKNLQRAGHIVTLDNQLGADELFAMQRDIVNIESTHDLNINGYLGSGIGGDMDQVFNDVHSDERKKELGITAMTAEARDDLVDRLAFYRYMVQTDSVPGGEMVSLIDHFYQPDFDVVESAIERYQGPNLNNDASNKFIDFTYTHTPTKDAETKSAPQQPAPSKVAPLPAPPA